MITWGTITLPVAGLKRLRSQVTSPRGPLTEALRSWTTIYGAFVVSRFNRFSRGGGDWRPLSPSTIEAKGSRSILVDKGQLKTGLRTALGVTEVNSGNTRKLVVAFKGGRRHRSGLPVSQLLSIHHLGLGVVPARRILARPDRSTSDRMAKVIAKAAKEMIRGSFH